MDLEPPKGVTPLKSISNMVGLLNHIVIYSFMLSMLIETLNLGNSSTVIQINLGYHIHIAVFE